MSQEPLFIGSDQDDLDDELTQLEWEATQRKLSPEEMEQLNQLHQQHKEILKDVQERVAPPDPGNPVVSGDDSP